MGTKSLCVCRGLPLGYVCTETGVLFIIIDFLPFAPNSTPRYLIKTYKIHTKSHSIIKINKHVPPNQEDDYHETRPEQQKLN